MPDKVISEAITSSRSWRRLSAPARELFAPLLVKTDAWGIRKADLEEIRLDCIPGYDWPDSKLLDALESLVREDVIELYLADGRWYLRITNHDRFQRQLVRLRRGKSRWPLPPELPSTAARSLLVRRYFDAFLVRAGAGARADGGGFGSTVSSKADGSLPVTREHNARQPFEKETNPDYEAAVEKLVACVADSDDEMVAKCGELRKRGLGPAAFHRAAEALVERRCRTDKEPLQSERRFVIGTLVSMLREGQYAA